MPRANPLAFFAPQSHGRRNSPDVKEEYAFMDRAEVDATVRSLVEPFNKKGVEISGATTFANDLEFDSLTVMDFVAAIEDEFDIIISMNQQAEIENFGQLVDAVTKLQDQ